MTQYVPYKLHTTVCVQHFNHKNERNTELCLCKWKYQLFCMNQTYTAQCLVYLDCLFCNISSLNLCNVSGYLHMLTDHTFVYIFLTWMMKNSYSYAVEIFLHVAGSSINLNPIPPQVCQVRPITTMCPKIDSMPFSAFALSCLLTFSTSALSDALEAQGCRLRSCPISTFLIPTPSFRAFDKMSVVTFSCFAWHKSFPANCIKHIRRILKVQEYRTVC